jgi:hypothetical protein
LLLAASPARAQSAADRATARSLATTGIKLYRAGNYKDALDKLTRAEALYDAPVHLLYIARCQVKLGKLVEGAETYRKLGRVKLSSNAPQAFKDAQDSGAKELSALEPKIPALRVEVQPADVNDMDVVIDGEHLPSAVVGIDRPADPGKHTVRVTAPGFKPTETTVEVQQGEKKPVKLTLEPGAGGGAAPAGSSPSGAAAGATAKAGGDEKGKAPPPTTAKKPPLIGFMAGVRGGATFFAGSAFQDPAGNRVKMSDFAGVGGGAELHGGVRIWHYFTPVLTLFAGGLKPPNQKLVSGGATLNSTSKADYQGGGLGVMIGTPPGRFGGFGELDVTFDSVSQHTTLNDLPNCSVTTTLSGTGGRIGGGVVIPVAPFLQLTPFAMVTAEKFDKRNVDIPSRCGVVLVGSPPGDQTIQNQTLHTMLFLGLGGDFIFGADKPLK